MESGEGVGFPLIIFFHLYEGIDNFIFPMVELRNHGVGV